MPTKFCNTNQQHIAQTLFLGASVTSFTNNLGWGTQPSQLTVNLIEDELEYKCGVNLQNPKGGALYDQFPNSSVVNVPNHYHTCNGNNCFIDRYTGAIATDDTPIENKILPGKVYYELSETLGLVSKYWIKPDPGFFGRKTRIRYDGLYSEVSEEKHPNYKFDIIDTPVYFKMGDFQFGGFIQSWTRNISSNKTYTVVINGPQAILNSCYIIIDKYGGSIFSKHNGNAATFGSPKNYLGSIGANYNSTNLYDGVLPNIFNIYGFVESFGQGNFGVAKNTDQGMSINLILESLMALTSTAHDSPFKLDTVHRANQNHAVKRAFSPFGRIISKCMTQEDQGNVYKSITSTFNKYGAIYPKALEHMLDQSASQPRCQFILDLHDVLYTDKNRTKKRFADNIRISGPILSITELLNNISDRSGHDFDIELIPKVLNNKLYHIIKVKTISRLKQPTTNIIENTIKTLECNGFPIASNNIGKEKNETPARCLLLGGQQQRLYQVKSYRLAYSQSNFIYNPRTRKFVNYYSLSAGPTTANSAPSIANQYGHGKIRFPNFNSSRNVAVVNSSNLNDDLKAVLNSENEIQKIANQQFDRNDPTWRTNTELKDGVPVNYGNYESSIRQTHSALNSSAPGGRWFPLYMDNICPFFGFVYDNKIGMKVGDDSATNTDFRKIRPVWYDTWTSQISVVVRVAELPQLNVPINRTYLETDTGPDINGYNFTLPKTANLDPPTRTYNDLGLMSTYTPIEYFVLTESEIRAAIAGFDNFLVYSLAKTYKPDLIELVRRAYYIKTRDQLINNDVPKDKAEKIAYQETDWYWKLLGANIAGDELYPTVVYPDKNDGSQYIQEKALQDLKLIHKFITEIAKYYGKKYMVNAGPIRGYKEESVFGKAFPTNVGYGYIFTGDGTLRYNYTPTNDGAWEETGNIIDDAIVVGGTAWMSLTDDSGKIKPILGYNNNYNYDYIRQAKCIASNKTNAMQDLKRTEANPYFSFNNWLTLHEYKTTSCTDSYVFPSLDISSLSTTEYVIIDQKYSPNQPALSTLPQLSSLPGINLSTPVKSYDAWGTELKADNEPLPRSKLYVTTSVQEGFVFLNPENLSYPRILIDSPGINLNLSSEENAKDPNRTVITNVAAEDLMLYMKTTIAGQWDYDWIRYMLNYISPIVLDDADNPYFLGLYTVSSNQTANNVELAPKAAHPFFAGIPIRSNQFIYGPWTNYPISSYTSIFPTGSNVNQSQNPDYTLTCVETFDAPITLDQAKKAIDNLITNIDIDVNDDLVPWNYGGMYQLDIVALKEIETKINYQSIIETAQLEMAGLPLFNLGGHFVLANTGVDYTINKKTLNYVDAKDPIQNTIVDLSYIPGANVVLSPLQPNNVNITYSVIDLNLPDKFSEGPIITSIQTSVNERGISTSYSFRTYTRKLGLFNKEETDRIKKFNKANLLRGKQIAQINQEIVNLRNIERENMLQERLNKAQFGSSDLSSKLFSWSPSTVLIGQASPLIDEPSRTPKIIEDFSYASDPGAFNTKTGAPTAWKLSQSTDTGQLSSTDRELLLNTSSSTLKSIARVSSTVQLYQRKEVENQLQKDYGMQSAMSLDGLLSPISFYPTFKNSTFSYSLHNTANCPFCNGTKIRQIKTVRYVNTGNRQTSIINIACDKCTNPSQRLNAKIEIEPGETPINLITLNPIVVPYGEFKNANVQNYTGAHPAGAHVDISSLSPGLAGRPRVFRDRMRHCIEIVARGSVPQNKTKYALETSRNLRAQSNHPDDVARNNLDYYQYDSMLFSIRSKIGDNLNVLYENNQRFFGLRGPLTLHSWGYDEDNYPVPNAADEPLAYDDYGRPMRFKTKSTYNNTAKKFKSLSNGQLFQLQSGANNPIYAKTFNNQGLPSLPQGQDTNVYTVTVENDLSANGGFDPLQGYIGDIISKTQKWTGSSWTDKVKLNEFYLNWAERPDLWRVGPIDLHWDSKRMVWTGGEGGAEEKTPPYIVTNSNDISTLDEFYNKKSKKKYIYRMIYATLEEDLIKQPDFDETFATRAFIDDVEFSKEPLLQGYRRLIYIKDKCGYTAPIGTKLLCKYNRLTGFYEPITKPTVATKGKIINGSSALIDLNYVQGRRSGKVPTRTITFENPLTFNTISGSLGIFMFMSGKWTLTAVR